MRKKKEIWGGMVNRMKTNKIFTRKEFQAFGEFCRDSEKDRILKLIDELFNPEELCWKTETEELKQKIEGKK